MSLPSTWAELQARLSSVLDAGDRSTAQWLREALAASYGVEDVSSLDRRRRALAFQRFSGVCLALEDGEDPSFLVGHRAYVSGIFARYLKGVQLDGPPWKLDPYETDRPSYKEWLDSLDFGEV